MILGIGIDIIEINRIQDSIDRLGESFLNKIFTPHEIDYCESKSRKFQHYAVRFAAKEAVYKAFTNAHQSGISWQNIEVNSDTSGMPTIKLIGLPDLEEKYSIQISLSHSDNYAVCTAIVILK